MKKISLIFSAAVVVIAFSACNSGEKTKADVDNLSQYVDSVDKMEPVYTEASWATIEAGYKDRSMKVDKKMTYIQGEEKEMVEATRTKYEALELKYKTKIEEAKKPDYRVILRNTLFGEGKIGTDMKFGWVTADNIKDVYDKFVNTVEDHKNDYTREDWDEIKLLYEGLDNRKNEVEKDLATKDNLAIAGLKIKFAAIKSVHRPLAKVDENEKTKEK